MPKRINILYIFIVALIMQSCYPPEEFSNTPAIAFRSLTYSPSDVESDSLVLNIDFQDGDGDLGAEIEGEIKGTLEITDVLTLHPTAIVNGDIITGKLVVQAGAKFNGACKMGAAANNHKEVQVERKERAKASA